MTKQALQIIFLLSVGTLYLCSLPLYVQGGDTGELVAAAYRRLVAHPPGYPIWVWVQHAWTQTFTVSTVFWRAALLNALFALGVLGILARALWRHTVAFWLCVPLLALSTVFTEAALLPEVFSLHALFVAALWALYLFREGATREWLIPFLFFAGFAHHLTIVLTTPIVAGLIWELRRSRPALVRAALGSLAGLAVAAGAYASLLALHTTSPFSWGELRDFSSLWHHFLRGDYGTFQLVANEAPFSLWVFQDFAARTLLPAAPLLVLAAWALFRNRKLQRHARLRWAALSALASALFLFTLNLPRGGMSEEIALRFHLMPLVQLAFLGGFILTNAELPKRAGLVAAALFAPAVLFLLVRAAELPRLRPDSVMEDYAVNLLAQAERHGPALVLAESDHAFYSLRYAQAVLGEGSRVTVAVPPMFFHPWFEWKVRARLPEFRLPNRVDIFRTREMRLETDLFAPNLRKVRFVVTKGYPVSPETKVTFLGLGRLLGPGGGVFFDEAGAAAIELYSPAPRSTDGPQAFGKKFHFAQYSHFYLAKGRQEFSTGNLTGARASWEKALSIVPYALPALINLCVGDAGRDPRCQEEALERVRREAAEVF